MSRTAFPPPLFTTAVQATLYTVPPHATPVERAPSKGRAVGAWQMAAVVVVVSAVYAYWHLGRGWIPHDEGTLAQSAQRVLQGQLPHRDYDEIYSGGLAYLDAAAFRLLGTSLWSLRLALFAVFLGWVPTVFYVASRFVRPPAAAAVTLTAVAWSIPNYPAPMPSWFNLFFATFGAAALLRHVETRRARWLVIAGLCGGLSFLVKVIGLYFVAAALLFLVFEAHTQSLGTASSPRRGVAYSAFVSAALLGFIAALGALVRHQQYAPEYVHFMIPGAAIAALLMSNEWRVPAGDSHRRFVALARLLGPFLIGVALPVALFLVPYARSGALGAFFNGIFVLPTKRFSAAAWRALPLVTMLSLVPIALLAWLSRQRRFARPAVEATVLGAAVAALVVLTGRYGLPYRVAWYSVRTLIPVLVVGAVVVLARPRAADAGEPLLRSRTMVLVAVTALCSLVQFPFAAPIYFCYVAPLAVLLATALVRYLRPASANIPLAVLAFYGAFAVVRLNTATIYLMGVRYQPYPVTVPYASDRVRLSIQPDDVKEHEALVAVLNRHARGGYTWASPDCPQVYYLAGLKNPTRALFEFFDDTAGYTARILTALDTAHVTAVVLNRRPEFSRGITLELFSELEKRYPYSREIGRFHVRWRT